MSRQDFELIARTVKLTYGTVTKAERNEIAVQFADALAGTNPRFNRPRFLAACGVPERTCLSVNG